MFYINELREGEMVKETYLCKQFQTMKTKAGKSYYSLMLQDKTGMLDAKVWDLGNGIDHFEALDYIHVEGQVTSFQNSLQLNIKRIRKSQEGEYDPADFLPVSDRNLKEMHQELLSYASRIQEPHLKALVNSFFVEDKEFLDAFMKHSAAKSVHHSFIGGLLEHTLNVTKVSAFFAKSYPILNYDLLITSAMFHDIGKLEELSNFPENDYTDIGNLIGHIVIGVERLGTKIKTIQGFPVNLANQLKHCILAHHGELEYGSPKKPALAEAMALNFADNFDAKMQTMKELLSSSDEKLEWLGYQRLFESNIRRTEV